MMGVDGKTEVQAKRLAKLHLTFGRGGNHKRMTSR